MFSTRMTAYAPAPAPDARRSFHTAVGWRATRSAVGRNQLLWSGASASLVKPTAGMSDASTASNAGSSPAAVNARISASVAPALFSRLKPVTPFGPATPPLRRME